MLNTYFSLAWKVLSRRKFFTAISLFGISFTLLVLIVASAMLDKVVAPGRPETRQARTLESSMAMMYGGSGNNFSVWTSDPGYLLFDRYARDLPGVERLGIYSTPQTVYSYINGQKIASTLKRTDAAFWQILDFTFIDGGPLTDADVRDGRTVAVVNETTRRRFFGDAPAIGRTLEADGQRYTVVGVVDDVSSLRLVPFADIWTPVTSAKSDAYRRELMGGFNAIVLARDASLLPSIREEFNARLARVDMPDRNFTHLVAPIDTKFDALARLSPLADRRDPAPQGWKLVVLLGVAAFLFALLPAVNLVNVNVSRIMERASEIGVRKAFGASRGVLVGQFILENVVLTLVGAAVALAGAEAVLALINRSGIIPYAQLAVNIRTFVYGVVLAIGFGLLSGAYPAWRMSRLNPAEALKGGAR